VRTKINPARATHVRRDGGVLVRSRLNIIKGLATALDTPRKNEIPHGCPILEEPDDMDSNSQQIDSSCCRASSK